MFNLINYQIMMIIIIELKIFNVVHIMSRETTIKYQNLILINIHIIKNMKNIYKKNKMALNKKKKIENLELNI